MVKMLFIVCGAEYLTTVRNVGCGPVDVSITISYMDEEDRDLGGIQNEH